MKSSESAVSFCEGDLPQPTANRNIARRAASFAIVCNCTTPQVRKGPGERRWVLNRFGETTNGQPVPLGKPWGQTAKFRQTAPEIGVSPGFATHFRPAFPKTVKHPRAIRVGRDFQPTVMRAGRGARGVGTETGWVRRSRPPPRPHYGGLKI